MIQKKRVRLITFKSVILSVLLIGGIVIPVQAAKSNKPVVMGDVTKIGFFGVGVLIGFMTHVTARPEDWRDPAIVSGVIAAPAGWYMIRTFDQSLSDIGCKYVNENNRGIDLSIGVLVGACAGKAVRYTIKGVAKLACMLAHKVREPQQQQEIASAQ